MIQPKQSKKVLVKDVRRVADSLQSAGKEKIRNYDSPFSIKPYTDRVASLRSGGRDLDNADRYNKLADNAILKSKKK